MGKFTLPISGRVTVEQNVTLPARLPDEDEAGVEFVLNDWPFNVGDKAVIRLRVDWVSQDGRARFDETVFDGDLLPSRVDGLRRLHLTVGALSLRGASVSFVLRPSRPVTIGRVTAHSGQSPLVRAVLAALGRL